MDLWQMVIADHVNIEELCREVLHASGSGPNSRAHLFSELDTEMERHIRAKERVLYPALARHDLTRSYLSELGQEHEDIRRRINDLAENPNVNSHEWAMDFKELASIIRHYFSLERHGLLTAARGMFEAKETEALRRSYERAKMASIEARRWHLPEAIMPSRYGLPTGTVFGVLASAAAMGAAALLWRGSSQQRQNRPLRPVHRQPAAPFPLRSRVAPLGQGRSRSQGPDLSEEVMRHGARSTDQLTGGESEEHSFSSANPPRAPSDIATPLQPGGLAPGGGPGASMGSVGTGGGQTESRDAGSLKRGGQ